MANIFILKITSTIYYSSIGEALTTFVIMTIAALVTTVIFIHTIYKFFCEKIPIFDGEVIVNDRKQNSENSKSSHASVRVPRPNSMSTRSRGGSRSGHSHPAHSKQISFLIAGLTICYLLNASLYTFINCLIRLLMIFCNVNISCYYLGYAQISYILIKISFYVLFIVRLHLTFADSNLAVKPLYLTCICSMSILLLIAAFIYFLFDVESQFESAGFDCSQNANFNLVAPLLPAVFVDTTTCIILLYLFINKLSQLIRYQTSSITSFTALSADKYLVDRIKNLILVMTKLTVLVCVYIIGYWFILFTFFPLLPGSAIMIDIVVGTFCVIFCYEFHENNYDYYCMPCKYLCFHACFWWFIICKTEDINVNSLRCKDICCPESNLQRKNKDNDKKEVMLTIKETNNNTEEHNADNNIEAMIMHSQIELDNNAKECNDDKRCTDPAPMIQKVASLSIDEFEHEKTNTFIINLNVDQTILEQENVDIDDEKVDIDDENGEIRKAETNTFDYRAQRLREMHQLFFGDTFKTRNTRKRNTKNKKQNSKNKKLMGKKFETDFNIYDDEKNDNEMNAHEKAKKSQTAIF